MHSILLTHRNRNALLDLCIWSIRRSANVCGVTDYEIVVAEHGSDQRPDSSPHVRVIVDLRPMPVASVNGRTFENIFNKPRLQNVAIDAALGDVLSFLDCDAIVGPKWMSGIEILHHDPTITRLCYRVRRLPQEWLQKLWAVGDKKRAELLARCFTDYNAAIDLKKDRYEKAFEAYRRPECDRFDTTHSDEGDGWMAGEVHGNSQFSIRRERLGGVRPNEEYSGRGMEDIEFNRAIFRAWGGDLNAMLRRPLYKGFIRFAGDHNMFHVSHTLNTEDWDGPGLKKQNADRFNST